MNKQVCYGDQVYIEISNLLPPPNTDTRLLFSNGFLEEKLFGVKAGDFSKTNFRSCVFTVLPSLVDSKEDLNTLRSLGAELSFLSASRPNSVGEKYLQNEIKYKEEQVNLTKEALSALNKKILKEMDNTQVCYGDIVLLQHLESGYYLCADGSNHPQNSSLSNLKLQKDRAAACYFQFYSFTVASDRSPIDYEGEMKLMSVHLGTVTMGQNKVRELLDLTSEDDETQDKDAPTFPADAIRRENTIKSFSAEPLIIGTALDSQENNKIRLAKYCTRSESININKRKAIKNGDYIRLQLEDFYLTASKSIYRQNFGLYHHNTEGYRYNFINSIFQVIKIGEEEEYPRGSEIQSNAKRMEDENEVDRYYLKHFVTGQYLTLPGKQLYEQLEAENDEMAERPSEIPSFCLINNSSKNQKAPLARNSKILLKAFECKGSDGQFYLESTLEPYKILQFEINSLYFVGFNHPEDKIKNKLKLVKKFITGHQVVGSFFKVDLVSTSELRKILEFESYANALKNFMRCLQCIFRYSEKVNHDDFASELKKMLKYSQNLIALINSDDAQVQILAREFRILDIIMRFLYYFLASDEIGTLVDSQKCESSQVVKLVQNFSKIILDTTNNNDLTLNYVTQYVRIFTNALFSPSKFVTQCDKDQIKTIKDCTVALLCKLLWEKDSDTFGQLPFYEANYFECLEAQSDYSTHLLQLMTHYCSSKIPNQENTIRANFVLNYLSDETKLSKLFPKITPLSSENDFEIELEREGYDKRIRLSQAPTEVLIYVEWVFKTINSIAWYPSLKFWKIIMEYYPEVLCEQIVGSRQVIAKIKNQVLQTLRLVHFAYNKLPFDSIPPKIQIMLSEDKIAQYHKQFHDIVHKAAHHLISKWELSEMETMKTDLVHAKRISIEELSLNILNEEFQRIKTGNLQGLAFTLQIMDNLINDQENLSNENLYIIYHSLAFITIKASEELTSKKPGAFYGPFAENASKIFSVLSRIDDHIVHMAFQQSLNDMKNRVLKVRSNASPLKSSMAKSQLAIISTSFASLEGEITKAIEENLVLDWKSKEKLYDFGGKLAEKEERIPDKKLMEALWKIVESDDLSLTTAAVHLIKNKSHFECKLTKELADSALFVDETEVSQFMELVKSLLNINQIGRRIQAITQFKLPHRENNQTLDNLIKDLQQILLTIYDYQLHLEEENENITEEDAKSIFLQRFEYSKTATASEIPFKYKDACVKVFYQRVMKVLKAPYILVPFIKQLAFQEAFEQDLDAKKLKHAISLFINLIVLFEYKNTANQNYMAEYTDFVLTFYNTKVLNVSPEAINMFTELCKDNKKLLKVSEEWLFKVFAYTFIGYINPFTVANQRANAASALPINYMRSVPVLFTSEIPKDMFDPVEIMTTKFKDFYQFMNNDDRISIETLLSQTNDGMAGSIGLKAHIANTSPDHAEKIVLDMPVYYTILKEFLLANAAFSLTRASSTVKDSLSLERVIPFITNQNIEFNFALKQLTLQAFENAYFKNKVGNVLLDQSELGSLASLLLIDVFGYLKNRLQSSDPIFDYLNTEYFSLAETKCYLEKYNNLIAKTNLDKVVFLEYQSITQFKIVWKDYIYYIMAGLFKNIIDNCKKFMTRSHDKDKNSKNIFEIWLDLIIKLRDLDHDASTCGIIDDALKHAIIHPEYAEYHKKIYAILGNSNKILNVNTISVVETTSSSKARWKPDLQTLIEKYFGDQRDFKHRHTNANLRQTASLLSSNTQVFKKLIRELTVPETPVKDILFIIKLLRNFIEIGNQTEANIEQPMYSWIDVSAQEYKKIRKNQNILNELNIVHAIFDLLSESKQNFKVFTETLSLSIALLYGGNKDVQNSFYEEFKQDYDNEVIETLARILESSIETLRKAEAFKTKKSYSKALRFIYDYFLDQSEEKIDLSGDFLEIPEKLKLEINQQYTMKRNKEFFLTSSELENRTVLNNILKFFQSLCEGHYHNFQEFLRDQTLVEHARSTNIPEFLRQAYHSYYKEMNAENVEIGSKIISLLIELEQGESQPNVNLLLKKTFISDLCQTLNGFNSDLDLLSRGFGFNADNSDFMELKSRALVVLKDLVERAEPADMKEIKQYINLRSLVATFKQNLISFHQEIGHYPAQKDLEADHIWNSNLSSAFIIYFILRHLSVGEAVDGDFSPEITEAFNEILANNRGISQSLANKYLNIFFKQYTGSIEILKVKSQKLMTIYFPISAVYTYLKKDTKTEFENKVDRSNTQTKIADLMDNSDELIEQANVEYQSRNKFLGFNFTLLYNWLRYLTNILALTVIVFNIFQLIYVDKSVGVEYRNTGSDTAQTVINSVQSAIAALLVLLWIQTRCRRYLAFKWNEVVSDNVKEQGHLPQYMAHKIEIGEIDSEVAHAVLDLKGPFSEEWDACKDFAGNTLATHNFIFAIQSPLFLWHMFYLGICIGSSFHPLVTAFQLFDIVVRSDTVSRIATAISRNATQFLWTLVLLFTTVYVYSVIGMYFLHDRYDDGDVGDLCTDGYSCFLASLNQGLRSGGGIADALQKIAYSSDRKWAYLGHTIFDLSFFIIIIIILLNLIFGMIIDAFGELRDEKNSNEDDKKNVCFICGLSRSEYERTSNFDKHINQEHDKWQYLAYVIYLLDKKRRFATDLSDVEDYILSCYLRKDYCWLPVGRSLTFERHYEKEEGEKRSEVDIMKDDIMGAIQLMAEQNKMILSKLSEVYAANTNQSRISAKGVVSKFRQPVNREINIPNSSPERKLTKPE